MNQADPAGDEDSGQTESIITTPAIADKATTEGQQSCRSSRPANSSSSSATLVASSGADAAATAEDPKKLEPPSKKMRTSMLESDDSGEDSEAGESGRQTSDVGLPLPPATTTASSTSTVIGM